LAVLVLMLTAHALVSALAFFDLLFTPLLSPSLCLLHLLSLFGGRQAQLLLGAGSNSDAFCRSCGISRRIGCWPLDLPPSCPSTNRRSDSFHDFSYFHDFS
jgi:hypothetical protein